MPPQHDHVRLPSPLHARNRVRLLAQLQESELAGLFTTGSRKVRNHDSEHRFRPDSDFWYLTGFAEPDSVLVLAPLGGEARSILFLRERDRDAEIWTGRRLGVEAAPEVLGVDAAFPIQELWERLPDLLAGHEGLVYRTGVRSEHDVEVLRAVQALRRRAGRGVRGPEALHDPIRFTHEMRLHKSAEEVAWMRRAADLSTEAHVGAMALAEPGRNEAEIDALLDYTFRRRGGTGSAYTNIVAGGANACILHYEENDRDLVDGELLLIDAGAEWSFYASDVTRTFPVNGRFTSEQSALYGVVLDAQKAAIATIAPGAPFDAAHRAALHTIAEGLIRLGLLEGPLERVLEQKLYQRFFMHRTGHWLGLDVHDCGSYYESGESRPLAAGMVTTVEPGIYVAPDDEQVAERWRGIGIRIEDDVLVTPEGCDVLTSAIPKELEEVEAACAGAELARASAD